MSQDGIIGLTVLLVVGIVFLFILLTTGVIKQGFNNRKTKMDRQFNSLLN